MNKNVSHYILVGLGLFIASIGINTFSVPNHLYSGGLNGIALIIYYITGYPVGMQTIVMNIPLLYLAYRFLGKEFALSTVYGIVVFGLALDATKFLAAYNLIDDPLTACVAGGVVIGIGYGITFKNAGSGGGTNIIAVIIKKYYSLGVGFVGFVINIVIMAVAALLFGLKLAVITLISMYITGIVTDKVMQGFNHKKSVLIISQYQNEIAAQIAGEIGRSATFFDAEGGFSRQTQKILLVVVSLSQLAKVKDIVKKLDPTAFVILHDATEVMGRGFTLPMTKADTTADNISSLN